MREWAVRFVLIARNVSYERRYSNAISHSELSTKPDFSPKAFLSCPTEQARRVCLAISLASKFLISNRPKFHPYPYQALGLPDYTTRRDSEL